MHHLSMDGREDGATTESMSSVMPHFELVSSARWTKLDSDGRRPRAQFSRWNGSRWAHRIHNSRIYRIMMPSTMISWIFVLIIGQMYFVGIPAMTLPMPKVIAVLGILLSSMLIFFFTCIETTSLDRTLGRLLTRQFEFAYLTLTLLAFTGAFLGDEMLYWLSQEPADYLHAIKAVLVCGVLFCGMSWIFFYDASPQRMRSRRAHLVVAYAAEAALVVFLAWSFFSPPEDSISFCVFSNCSTFLVRIRVPALAQLAIFLGKHLMVVTFTKNLPVLRSPARLQFIDGGDRENSIDGRKLEAAPEKESRSLGSMRTEIELIDIESDDELLSVSKSCKKFATSADSSFESKDDSLSTSTSERSTFNLMSID